MKPDYWRKQTADRPLFGDLLWSRPENRAAAGKLLIIGGHEHGFVAPSEAFGAAEKAGIGTARMVLPESLKKYVGATFEAGVLAPATPSGGFARASLSMWLEQAGWADGVLIAGDLGRGSETAIALEQFTQKYSGQLTLTKDAVDFFAKLPGPLLSRPDTTLILSLAQLQQLAKAAHFEQAITFGMDLLHLVDFLHEFSERYPVNVIVKHLENIFVSASEQVSTTKLAQNIEIWRVPTASHAAVWWLQNPGKTFEALTSAILQ